MNWANSLLPPTRPLWRQGRPIWHTSEPSALKWSSACFRISPLIEPSKRWEKKKSAITIKNKEGKEPCRTVATKFWEPDSPLPCLECLIIKNSHQLKIATLCCEGRRWYAQAAVTQQWLSSSSYRLPARISALAILSSGFITGWRPEQEPSRGGVLQRRGFIDWDVVCWKHDPRQQPSSSDTSPEKQQDGKPASAGWKQAAQDALASSGRRNADNSIPK